MVKTYRAGRRIKLQPQRWREPGQLVPEAHTWYRLDSYLHTGWLTEATVTEDEFRAAVAEFCPDLAGQALPAVGLDEAPPAVPQAPARVRTAPAKRTRPGPGH